MANSQLYQFWGITGICAYGDGAYGDGAYGDGAYGDGDREIPTLLSSGRSGSHQATQAHNRRSGQIGKLVHIDRADRFIHMDAANGLTQQLRD